jgi:hypothetical protein
MHAAPQIISSSQLVITVHDTQKAAPPTIGTFRVKIKPEANLRNIPPVCRPSDILSPALTGGFGPSRIVISDLSAYVSDQCNMTAFSHSAYLETGFSKECDSVYGNRDLIEITFDQNVTLCLGKCG